MQQRFLARFNRIGDWKCLVLDHCDEKAFGLQQEIIHCPTRESNLKISKIMD